MEFLLLLDQRLCIDQGGVHSLLRHELLVIPRFLHFAVNQHQDIIAVLDRAESMSDRDRRDLPARRDLVDCGLNLFLRFGIQRRGRCPRTNRASEHVITTNGHRERERERERERTNLRRAAKWRASATALEQWQCVDAVPRSVYRPVRRPWSRSLCPIS